MFRYVLLSRSDPDRFSLTNYLMDHEEERSSGNFIPSSEIEIVKLE